MKRQRQALIWAAGEDLPLFTGQAPTVREKPFVPRQEPKQGTLIDMRPAFGSTAPEQKETEK